MLGDITTISTACHTAQLDPVTGRGLLIAPKPTEDVAVFSALFPSVHAADELAMLRTLDGHGFDLGEDGEAWEPVGQMTCGRTAYYLYGKDSIRALPSMEELSASFSSLTTLAGLIPAQRC